ncbi:UDP-N-acetylmuramate: L-alanyl-gamma-D-glutamyl-meso-diaminopimelate ligase [Nitrosomonas aestuarii]|uniref:UDP-N-acetylmuramate--L-alanyl-gamma-D-glutamyl-meso-2,6-diaminoheptandioate ligase n=1 Tax=Nitrosomonas aestuarii TaxID=52441 RepID=A0A1I4ERQ4_9PROT|nr:UDP-N-acetylmuramate:L-alanyl-gamma-D-glutamyl-meso-diaminopimelate ligase [Nitrosomonas aestuarii]SFL07999.1 UDP-N-acetylmuramate: L-alanyl-gamma-D-glutamyl-meso-diaminopimelate ligase [Nitrosomonas aestuarii]
MHIHILGICGTFMGGIAAIAKESGFKVTGCDQNVYPPMSTQLETLGIELTSGFSVDQINLKPDVFVIGNVVTRGNPLMEEILNQNLPYVSGPQWLSENILNNRWVLAVAGTHGKTTTSSMLAWILEYAGLHPGFLIGGIPENFGTSARIGHVMRSLPSHACEVSPFFVIEADEYDTAFFDKRSKFVHYRPKTVVLNNLEFDHADIFENLAAIERQFHHFVRIVPNKGLIISNGNDQNLTHVLAKGCWTPVERFGIREGWHTAQLKQNAVEIFFTGQSQGYLHWQLLGEHNRMNALAALAAARHAGVPVNIGLEALARFKNVKRRMEKRGVINEITVYDDFAHHPTAIQTTIDGLRGYVGNGKRIIAVLEPRSNTMKMGVWKEKLADSLNAADRVFCYSTEIDWIENAFDELGEKAKCFHDLSQLINTISDIVVPGDHVLIMSNGGFGGIHEKLMTAISNKL